MKYKAKDMYHSVNLEDIALKGKIAKLMDTFFYERVTSEYARNTIYQETEDAFKNQLDDQGKAGIWQGEYWGKWIISAARVCRYYQSDELKAFITQATRNLITLQREDGYLNTYKNSSNMFSPNPEDTITEMGWPCKWNWNIWCRKYTLWGLLESYELTKEKETLTSAIRLADHLLKELSENQFDILKTGMFYGVASCSIMKPMLLLYGYTDNPSYLDFCIQIADRWSTPEIPGLIYNSLAMKRIDTWYEDTLGWSKTYESLSCFDGLIQLYRITGNPDYLQASENFYELLEASEKNLLFSVGYNDQYFGAADEINVLTEPCDAIHYIRVCYELFKLTGKVKYMDSIELVYYNAFLAAACKDGKWGARTVRGSGKQEYAQYQAKMNYNHCCVNNMPRGFLNAAECCVLAAEKEVLINMYHSYEAKIKVGNTEVQITTFGNYLAESRASMNITFIGKPVDLLFRIPSWSKKSSIRLANTVMDVQPGIHRIEASALEALITNSSTQGITLEVIFDNTAYILPFTKPVVKHDCTDYQYRRWGKAEDYEQALGRTFLDAPRCIIQKGTILLCRSKLIGNTAEEMFDGKQLINHQTSCTLQEYEEKADVMASFIVHFANKDTGEPLFSTKVCDYASAANIMQDDPEYFSIYF